MLVESLERSQLARAPLALLLIKLASSQASKRASEQAATGPTKPASEQARKDRARRVGGECYYSESHEKTPLLSDDLGLNLGRKVPPYPVVFPAKIRRKSHLGGGNL